MNGTQPYTAETASIGLSIDFKFEDNLYKL